jgi:hypothetical protein
MTYPDPAVRQSQAYGRDHRLPETEAILPGFRDAGRATRFGDDGAPITPPRRELLVVRPAAEDAALAAVIEEARWATAELATTLDKVDWLNARIGELMAVNEIPRNKALLDQIAGEGGMAGAEISLGQLIEARTGVCRHRSLLFKVLADDLGIPAALVRGNYQRRGVEGNDGRGGHAWNEVLLESGERILVDVMHNYVGELSDGKIGGYAGVDETPLYPESDPVVVTLPPPPTASAEDLAVLRAAPFVSARSPNGRGGYVFLDALDEGEAARLRAALDATGVRHDDYATSLGGAPERRPVLRVRGAAFLKLVRYGANVRHKAPARPQAALA